MQRYIIIRILYGLLTLFALSIVVFFLARLTGDPLHVLLPLDAKPEDYANMARQLGLDKPLPVQYGVFLWNALQGDLGNSTSSGRPAIELALGRLPATLELSLAALLISVLIALPTGVRSAEKPGTALDTFGKGFAIMGQSMPVFWLGLVLALIFAVKLHWLPASGRGGIMHLILPAFCLGWYTAASLMRLIRSGMLDVLGSEYIKMAKIKGVPRTDVVWKHALKNGSMPAVTMAGWQFAQFLGGSVVVETVFAWPGIGLLAFQSIGWRDFPIIQAVTLLTGAGFIFINLLVDILYGYLDPRIRYGKS